MTDILKDGGPAFPRNYDAQGHNGMTLRDWFAGQALAGLCQSDGIRAQAQATGHLITDVAARAAYACADAMLAARNEGAQ